MKNIRDWLPCFVDLSFKRNNIDQYGTLDWADEDWYLFCKSFEVAERDFGYANAAKMRQEWAAMNSKAQRFITSIRSSLLRKAEAGIKS